MAKKPPSFCGKCRTVHKDGICPHREAFQRKRKTQKTSGRGGSKWRSKRERIFNRDRFLCQICFSKGIYTSVELHGVNHGICDHIVPKSQGGSDDESNLQTICQSCDQEKTQQESKAHIGGASKV